MAGLSAADRQWLDRYGEMLRRDYPEVVARLAVFGSKARGEAGAESDLDVLLVVRDGHRDRIFEIKRAGYELRAAVGGLTMPQIFGTTESRWRRTLDEGMVFPNEVEDQAIDLIRDGVPVATAAACARRRRRRRAEACAQDGRRDGRGRIRKAEVPVCPADAAKQWRQALRIFREAEGLLRLDMGLGAVSRAYYAVLHATRAALFTAGINARTHRGTEMEFDRQLVQTGDLPEEWKGFYSTIMWARFNSDYGDADDEPELLSTSHDFVRRAGEYLVVIQQYLEKRGVAATGLEEVFPPGDEA